MRAAVAAKLGLPLAKVECIAPDVGGGFGVKIMHPWPEEVLIPWAARNLDHDVKWTEDRREHFISSSHERGQLQEVTVGFDDEGRLLALDVRFWHDNGAYTPYGIIVPIITATQLLGPYKPGTYRVEFWSLFTNTVLVTPYRGAGRPQGCFAMERAMDAIAAYLEVDRAEIRSRNFIQPDEMPYDQSAIHHATPVYEYLDGWTEDISRARTFEELPVNAQRYLEYLEAVSGCRISSVGVGPEREQTIVRVPLL